MNASLSTDENDSILTESIEGELLESTGNHLSFWDNFLSALSSGWILRPKSLTLTSHPVQAEFWVKRSKCVGDESERETCSLMIASMCKKDLEIQKHVVKRVRFPLNFTEKQEREALNTFSWERGLYNSIINLFSRKNPEKVCYKTICSHLLTPQAKQQGKWYISHYKDVVECTIHTFLRDFKRLNKNGDKRTVLPMLLNKKASFSQLLIPASMWSKTNPLLGTLIDFDKFLLSHPRVSNKLENDFLFILDGPHQFYIEIPFTRDSLEPKEAAAGHFAFIVPEPSEFITCIDSEGYISVIGGNMLKEITVLQTRLKAMKPKNENGEPDEQFQSLSKLVSTVSNSFNKKVTRFLCERFDYIFIPTISTTCPPDTVRTNILSNSLYMKLADNLHHKADTFKRQTIIKTHKYDGVENICSSCGIKGKAITEFGLFCCSRCGLRSDLSENQAKTAMLMYLKPYVKKMVRDSITQ